MNILRREFLLGSAAMMIVAGCQDKNQNDGLQDLSVRMKWFYSGTMAYWFHGLQTGIFENFGINLKINPGGPENSSVQLVAAGADNFGIIGADELLLAREKGIPLVALGVIMNDTPVSFVSHADSGITSPSDWAGKTIEITAGNNEEVQLKALIQKYSVERVNLVPYQYNLAPFLERKVDASIAYSMDQPVTLRSQGVEINEIRAMDFGINPYGDILVTTEEMLKTRPDLVKKFIDALKESITAAIEKPEEAVRSLVATAPELKFNDQLSVWQATVPFILDDRDNFLSMKESRWIETQRLLLDFGFLKQEMPLKDAVFYAK